MIARSSTRLALIASVIATISCGKSGPPLPPLVRVPVAPPNVAADRRGATVDLRFTVPSANTDSSHPANIERVDVYAITAPASVTDDQILKRGTRIASVDVKAPADPDKAADADEPIEDADPAVGTGLDQGTDAHVSETLTDAALKPADLSKDSKRAPAGHRGIGAPGVNDEHRPLMGPPPVVPTRVYALVGVATNGKRGPFSRRLPVPLVPPPSPPESPKMRYDEKAITVSWTVAQTAAPSSDHVLPARVIGATPTDIRYNVYDVSPGDAGTRLNSTPIAEAKFVDTRMAWDEERCYVVRAVETVGGLTIESAAQEPVCETLTDTFEPAAPANVKSVASAGVINLIWDANGERDLAGYLVFRGTGGELAPMTPAPIAEAHFEDSNVTPGVRYVYAVKAVDRAGNISAFSNRQEETAR